MGLTLTSSDPAPQTMADQMAAMNAGLVGKTGDDFDRAFIAEMIPHHQGAIAMAEQAIAHANHPEIRQMAEAIIGAQSSEITQMTAWHAAWFGGAPVPVHHAE